MNKTKRIASCPNLLSRPSRNRDKDLNNPVLLRKIQKQYDHHIPRILGHPIKLPALFTAVVVRGGYRAVCDRRLWSKVASDLHLPEACANSSIGLRRIYHHYLIKHELKEYPNLSEHYLTQAYAEFSTSETAASEFSFSSATTVERNLGIAPPDGTNTAFSPYSGYHSVADLSCALYQNTHRSSSLHPQDFSWRAGISEKSLTDQLDHLDSLGRTNPVDGSSWDDPTRLRDLTELTLVELALASGLPNEIDAALNALLALSINPCITTGASTSIRLTHCKNLLNLLLATVGIYDDSVGSFVICDPAWRQQTQTDFLKFWHNTVKDPRCRLFLRPDVFINPDPASDLVTDGVPSSTLTELFAPSVSSDFHKFHSFLSRAEVEDDLETMRVLLVATILVNLVSPPPTLSAAGNRLVEDDQDESDYDVFVARCRSPHITTPLATWRENARYLAASPTALRFAFLCAYAAHSGVRQLGLQLLPSLRYPLDPPRAFANSVRCPLEWTPLLESGGSRLSELTLAFLVRCLLESPDRASLIGGLNFLANLATVPEKGNEDSLLNGLPSAIWPRLAQLICLPDLAVVCATLEALRCLTNLGQYACAFAWQACLDWSANVTASAVPLILVQPLLALLTLEGQAMGSQSLHRIKLMQRTPQMVPPPSSHPYPPRPLPSSRVASNSTEWSTANHLPPPYHCRSLALSSPVVQPKMQRQPAEFTTRHHNSSFVRPSIVPRPSIHPQLSTGVLPDFVPTPARALPPSYRPPSGSTSCTGLINLLASSTSSAVSLPTPSPGSHSVSSNLSLGSSSLSNVVPPVIGRSVISTAPSTPTLSELTDRLQMPPPSLPPPSALRRSAKSSLSRTTSSSPSSPLPPCKPSTIASNNSCATVLSSVTHSSKSSTMSPDERPETKISVTNTKELPGSDCTVFRCETTSCFTESLVNSNGSIPVGEPVVNTRALLKLQSGRQPLVNGESKISVAHGGDDTLRETTIAKCRSFIKCNTGLQSHNSHVNGLKPGILQAAMEALHDAKLEKLGLSMEKKSDVLLNGLPECTNSSVLEVKSKVSV
ncbi:AT-rich interactive domain-containing protein 2 [Paragonimus westermani]|uniref:AT-rich interactive domain-containing protein 2 n=1 Tax=Paragonimus westermani TaxID=34504 RepID=A0A5J4NEK8_9TREM|nr:AT-rich interactive domain-containing protein 2 [Paragonimus westermani]